MLQRLQEKISYEEISIPAAKAKFPVPFTPGLEYNSPAHGAWNIVHTGMLIPGAHQIYVCAPNCARGVVLTAAEMDAMDRISTISLEEEDFYNGQMEEKIIEGTAQILEDLPQKPSAVLLFTVCVHHFMGTDLEYVYDSLRERFAPLPIVNCFMDPIMQKGGLSPDQKLRIAMYSCLKPGKTKEKAVNFIGSDLKVIGECEILSHLKANGYAIKDITLCKTYEEYLSMETSRLNIVSYPQARPGGKLLSERLSMEYVYFPQIFCYEKIEEQEQALWDRLAIPPLDTASLRKKCEEQLNRAKAKIGEVPLAVDASAFPYILSLTRFLYEHGFSVKRVYADSFLPEEKEDFLWLKKNAAKLTFYPTMDIHMRTMPRKTGEPYLAIGQKAAYFTQTPHFVNIVEGGGLLGYQGICHLADQMIEAWNQEKDTKDLVIRKGLGCVSCI